jgi:Polysaccharide pyruvyl transferase
VSKTILLWWEPEPIEAIAGYRAALKTSGFNFGNILIGNAVRTLLTKYDILTPPEIGSSAEANERCSQIVIPAANWLWKNFDFGDIADFIERTNLPVTIIGLGAQTNDRSTISTIHPNTMRLVRLIADRSASLGVRGFYTAEVLAANGIHNVEVIGCPSLFTNRCPTVKVDTSGLTDAQNLSINFSRQVIEHSFNPALMQSIENTVLRYALKRDAVFVAQDEVCELGLGVGESVDTKALTRYFSESDPKAVVEFFKSNTRHFLDYDSWAAYMRTRQLSIGTRFHGNLVALVNGVPALMIIHDSRTMELCTVLGIPHFHLNELPSTISEDAILDDKIRSMSFGLFESSYAALYQRFVRFLSRNGLDHNLPAPLPEKSVAIREP